MTDEQVTRALAEKVMGWHEFRMPRASHNPYWRGEVGSWYARLDEWQPLYKDEFACAVLDKMAERGLRISLHFQADSGWVCLVKHPVTLTVRIQSEHCRRRAIAIAALKAVGAWEE